MARLDIAVEHGQSPELAQLNFERAVATAHKRYAAWIHRIEWAPDRTAVTAVGSGFDVRISYDSRKVYARGTIPLALKLLEGPAKALVARAMAEGS